MVKKKRGRPPGDGPTRDNGSTCLIKDELIEACRKKLAIPEGLHVNKTAIVQAAITAFLEK